MSEFKREWLEKDYYKTLGVPRTASQKDITKAYRKLARQYHPDTNSSPAAEDKFKEISAAHSVLGDPKTRSSYDEAQKLGMFQSGPRTTSSGGVRFETDDLGQDLGGFFTRGGSSIFNFGRNWPKDGEDVRASVTISFDEAIQGKEVSVGIPGRGGRSQGKSQGRSQDNSQVKVRIPALVNDGALLKVRGKGLAGANGGQNGDLLVKVRVNQHPRYERDGLNLRLRQKLSFDQAALGGNIEVASYYGEKSTISIPPGTQPGQTLRLRGKGLRRGGAGAGAGAKSGAGAGAGAKSGAGDLFVEVQVDVPTSLTDKQRQAIEAMAEAFGEAAAGGE